MKPILSILIPTYNRAGCLDECLAAIAEDPAFADGTEVELVVSDNCSTDGTERVCRRYERILGEKMKYVRQVRNLGPSDNFTHLLRAGKGEFLKFQTDKVFLRPGAIGRLLEIVKRHKGSRPVLCFGGSCVSHLPEGEFAMDGFDELADVVSYWTTRIDGYGVWRDDVDKVVPLHDEYAASLLQQVAVIWRLFDEKRKGFFYNFNLVGNCRADRSSPGGYNVAEVFVRNYLSIIKPYLKSGKLSRAAYEREKKRLYLGHVYGMYFDFERYFRFAKGGFLKFTREYWLNWYYWCSLAAVPVFMLVGRMPPSMRQKVLGWARKLRSVVA